MRLLSCTVMSVVRIALPHHPYEVRVEAGALAGLGHALRKVAPSASAALFTDPALTERFGPVARAALHDAGYALVEGTLRGGEQHKTVAAVEALWQVLLDGRLDRRSPVVALGGGVTGDTVGFAAATYLRGVPFVQVPTTLLAMVDSSVGGKTGVNMPQGKNLVGAFHQPVLVQIDPLVLATLPVRELRCGLAECIKHGAIRDADLFAFTRKNMDAMLGLDFDVLAELVRRNVEIKAAVVIEDEREAGVRAHLNFGHTFAHAIEAARGYGEVLHGEAVALGMIAATRTAERAGLCDAALVDEIRDCVAASGLAVRLPLPDDATLLRAMQLDKKVRDGRVHLVLPERLGRVRVCDDVEAGCLAAGWAEIRDGG